jgi:Leucine-rich repeat (LRR) protein
LCNLDLSNTMLGPISAVHLAMFIKSMKQLKSLNMSRNRLCGEWLRRGHIEGDFDNTNFIMLLDAVAKSSSLTHVDISRNLLGEDCNLLAALLRVVNTPNIRSLNISGNNFDETDREAIVAALLTSSRMLALCGEEYSSSPSSSIDLSRRNLKPMDGAFLSTSMRLAPIGSISSLNLSDNFKFGTGGVASLNDWLTVSGLASLDISGVSLGPADCVSLASALLHPSCSLQTLSMRRNGASMTPDGFQRIAKVLRHNESLTSLDLSGSVPAQADLHPLGISVRCNKVRRRLKQFDLSYKFYRSSHTWRYLRWTIAWMQSPCWRLWHPTPL